MRNSRINRHNVYSKFTCFPSLLFLLLLMLTLLVPFLFFFFFFLLEREKKKTRTYPVLAKTLQGEGERKWEGGRKSEREGGRETENKRKRKGDVGTEEEGGRERGCLTEGKRRKIDKGVKIDGERMSTAKRKRRRKRRKRREIDRLS